MESENPIEELIIRYLQHDIAENELRELDGWIHESEENKKNFFQLKNLFDSRNQALSSSIDMRADSWPRMLTKINRLPESLEKGVPERKSIWMSCLKYVAIIGVAFGVGFGIHEFNDSSVSGNVATYNEIIVEKGGRANTVILSDGSKVVLNASTHFKYPAAFDAKRREVYLDGEAYFEVAKDAAKPFTVRLKNQEITVLGTSFNILAHQEDPYSVITLLSGSILLESFDRQGKKMGSMKMKPNQQARSDNESGSIFLSEVDATVSNAWIGGRYKFRDEKLSSIVRRLQNYYGVDIRLEDSLKDVCYTGTFSLDQTIQEVLRVINSEEQFSFTKQGKEIIISAKE